MNGKEQAVTLHLLNVIDPESLLHEIRGLNLKIQMIKSIKGIMWPRLLQQTDHYSWLSYNPDRIGETITELFAVKNLEKLKQVIQYIPDDEFDEDTVSDDSSIEDDVHDPFAE